MKLHLCSLLDTITTITIFFVSFCIRLFESEKKGLYDDKINLTKGNQRTQAKLPNDWPNISYEFI